MIARRSWSYQLLDTAAQIIFEEKYLSNNKEF